MKFLIFFTLLFITATSAFASVVALQVRCQPQDAGSKVYVDGILKGECPGDIIWLTAGPVTLEVKKMVGDEYEQYFSEQFTLYDGVPKRVNVIFSEPQLTPKAKKSREIAAFHRDKKAAETGDIKAMETLAESYENGIGTTKNLTLAKAWRRKTKNAKINAKAEAIAAREEAKLAKTRADARRDLESAKAGNVSAMEMMAFRYANGRGVNEDVAEAAAWEQKAQMIKNKVRLQKEEKEKARKRVEIEKKLEGHTLLIEEIVFKDLKNGDMFGAFIGSTIYPTLLPTDILTGTPIVLSGLKERLRLQKELDALASVWAKPDSMVAKAYRLHHNDNQEIAAR